MQIAHFPTEPRTPSTPKVPVECTYRNRQVSSLGPLVATPRPLMPDMPRDDCAIGIVTRPELVLVGERLAGWGASADGACNAWHANMCHRVPCGQAVAQIG